VNELNWTDIYLIAIYAALKEDFITKELLQVTNDKVYLDLTIDDYNEEEV